MIKHIAAAIKTLFPAAPVSAHCDGPCGVYDPASARIAAEAVLSMSKKIDSLKEKSDFSSQHSINRYIAIKEEQAHLAKTEILVLWTDYFKPVHLEENPDLHDIIWQATKLCSAVKVNNSVESAEELMNSIEKIHNIFWVSKGRNVAWVVAS